MNRHMHKQEWINQIFNFKDEHAFCEELAPHIEKLMKEDIWITETFFQGLT